MHLIGAAHGSSLLVPRLPTPQLMLMLPAHTIAWSWMGNTPPYSSKILARLHPFQDYIQHSILSGVFVSGIKVYTEVTIATYEPLVRRKAQKENSIFTLATEVSDWSQNWKWIYKQKALNTEQDKFGMNLSILIKDLSASCFGCLVLSFKKSLWEMNFSFNFYAVLLLRDFLITIQCD